jgi:hypothetical protein
VVCLALRALRDCAPSAPSGASVRPLNFTVRHARLTPSHDLMYAYLYDSMVTCYIRQHIGDRYVHWYAATTLTSMGFVNLLSLVAVFAHWHYKWAEKLFAWGSHWQAAAALGLVLLGGNLFYSRWRKRATASTPTRPLRSSWPANIYMLISVVAVMYVSTLTQPSRQ